MLTDKELANAVDIALREDNRSLEKICEDFNQLYSIDINEGSKKPLNKDFISRLRNNNFRVRTERILYFCEYIGVDLQQKPSRLNAIEQQVRELELFIKQKSTKNTPELRELRNFLNQVFNSKHQKETLK